MDHLGGHSKQGLYTLVINGAVFSVGCMIGWSVQASMINADPSVTTVLTIEQLEWLVASVGLSSIISSFSSAFLTEYFGPKKLIQMAMVPAFIAWILMATIDSYGWILTGRVIHGFYIPLIMNAVQPYIAEISSPAIRGRLSSFPEIFVSTGMLAMYIFAQMFSWRVGTLLAGMILVPVFIFSFYVPESPYWFLRENKMREAMRSLKKLRANNEDLTVEFETMKQSATDPHISNGGIIKQIRRLKFPKYYRPTILISTLFILRELSGALVIFTYAPSFFAAAGIALNPITATVVIGAVRLTFTIVGASLVDILGRRELFIYSSLVSGIMMIIVFSVQQNPLSVFLWLQLLAVVIYVASFAVGTGPIPWILLGEMLPTMVRSIGSSIATAILSVMYFLEGVLFPSLLAYFGLSSLVLTFAIFNFLAAAYVYFELPESKNKSLMEIQSFFEQDVSARTPMFTNGDFLQKKKGYSSLG